MTQALATSNSSLAESSVIDDTLLITYLNAMNIGSKLTDNEKSQFLQIAKAYGLNPFKREIYVTKYGSGDEGFSIVVGYETYLKRAERTGKLDGWEVEFQEWEDGELSAIITIFRKDWSRPFKWEVFYSEQVQIAKTTGKPNKFWQKRKQQLRKVAISQGMRLAFPDENGGLPYTSDEMAVEDTTHEVVDSQTERQPYERPVQARIEQAPDPEQHKPKTGKKVVADQSKLVDDYMKKISLAQDDESYNWIEETIGKDTNIPVEAKPLLIKGSLVRRIEHHAVDFDSVQAIKKRIAGWAKVMGEDNTIACLNDLIEKAADLGIKYANKQFYVETADEPETVEPEVLPN